MQAPEAAGMLLSLEAPNPFPSGPEGCLAHVPAMSCGSSVQSPSLDPTSFWTLTLAKAQHKGFGDSVCLDLT
jgi:hypothetical protein